MSDPSPLDRVGFPEGFSRRRSNPIRYIVREASHPVISATAARSPRGPVGIHRVYSVYQNYLLYLQPCDFVSHANTSFTGRYTDGWLMMNSPRSHNLSSAAAICGPVQTFAVHYYEIQLPVFMIFIKQSLNKVRIFANITA